MNHIISFIVFTHVLCKIEKLRFSSLSTVVASAVYAFVEKHSKSWIVATGSTEARTRLYRMGITNNLAEISEDFLVFGYTRDEKWVKFEAGEDYKAFL